MTFWWSLNDRQKVIHNYETEQGKLYRWAKIWNFMKDHFTHPKGIYSYRYFLPSNSFVMCSCIYIYVLAEYAWAGGKEFGVCIGWRKCLYECKPFGYVNLWKGFRWRMVLRHGLHFNSFRMGMCIFFLLNYRQQSRKIIGLVASICPSTVCQGYIFFCYL